MLKDILKLEGAQKLTKNEQKSIKGGLRGVCFVNGQPIEVDCSIRCPDGNRPFCIAEGDSEVN